MPLITQPGEFQEVHEPFITQHDLGIARVIPGVWSVATGQAQKSVTREVEGFTHKCRNGLQFTAFSDLVQHLVTVG